MPARSPRSPLRYGGIAMSSANERLDDLPLLEQAAAWFDRMSAGSLTEAERRRFEDWRTGNPAHALAYAEIEAAHATARAFAGSNEMLALRQETLSGIVVRRAARPWRLAVAAGIAALLVAAVSLLLLRTPVIPVDAPVQIAQHVPQSYRTDIGERLAATLPDGSRIVLNTDSRVRLAYTGTERRLILERGQALFEVAHGEARPFVVLAAGQLITATGTVFDVRIERGDAVKVSLVEGRVLVRADRVGAPTTALQPNEILVAASSAATVTREPEIERTVSWRNGLLIFEDDSLADAVAEMNRYVRRPIILQDDQVRRLRISGAFRTGETDTFIEAIQLTFPVRVVERRGDAIVLASRS